MENELGFKKNKNLISINFHPVNKFSYADQCVIKPISQNFFFVQDEEWINECECLVEPL